MKAAQITGYGGAEVVSINTEVNKPVIKPDEVLVEVHAASVNAFDWKLREGYMQQMIPLRFPATLGGDCAGEVAETGIEIQDIVVGEQVFGFANPAGGEGSFAKFTAVKAGSLAPKPKKADWGQAAALPLAASSAYQGLYDHIELKSGDNILIHGAAGGIGSFAVQMAKHTGAHVIATCATDDIDFVKGLGADEVIDYKTQSFETQVKELDAVFDTVGKDETFIPSHQVLKSGGVLVTMAHGPDEELAKQHGVKQIVQQSKVTTERLNAVAKLVDSGAIKVIVDKVFPLEQTGEALTYVQQGNQRGKVVIDVFHS